VQCSAVGAVVAVQSVSDQWPDGPRCPLVSPLGSRDTCARALQQWSSIAAGQRKTPPGRVMQVGHPHLDEVLSPLDKKEAGLMGTVLSSSSSSLTFFF